MMRPAGPADVAALRGFLEAHIETSMFLLGNLEAHGVEGSAHDHATRYFLWQEAGEITGVFGVTRSGYLMCQMPAMTAAAAGDFARALEGTPILGMTGAADQVQQVLDVFALPTSLWQVNEVQPLYGLDCAGLPESTDALRPAQEDDKALLAEWFTALLLDTGMAAGPAAREQGAARAMAAIGSERFAFLSEAGQPVAMSSITARAGQAVQVGGVFVPRALRGQGLGGRMVAAQLRQWRARSIVHAILFAASPTAAKAYERIGFRRRGDYRVALLKQGHILGAAT